MKKNRLLIIVAIEAIILFGLLAGVLFISKNEAALIESAALSEYSEKTEQGWTFNNDIEVGDSLEEVLDVRYENVKSGSYVVNIGYSSATDLAFDVTSKNKQNYGFIQAVEGQLLAANKSVQYKFNVLKDIDCLDVVIMYDGGNEFNVSYVNVVKTSHNFKIWFILLSVLFAIFDFVYIKRDYFYKNRQIWFVLMLTAFISSLPLFLPGIAKASDLDFHLQRIQGVASELRYLTFPVKISSFWNGGYGYAVSIYYGDIYLYFPALLRIAGMSLNDAYKVLLISFNIITPIVTYFSMNKIFKNKKIALFTSVAYSLSYFRLMDLYARAAVGESAALIMYPLIAAGTYMIINEKDKSFREYVKGSIILAAGMAGTICTHLYSVVMWVLALVIVCIISFKKVLNPKAIAGFASAVGLTCIFSLFHLIPMLDYYFNVDMYINSMANNDKAHLIQGDGIAFSQYFNLYGDIFKKSNNGNRWATPGLMLMLVLIFALWIIVNEGFNKTRKIALYLVLSALGLAMASSLFPWDYLASSSGVFNTIALIQFPFRLLGITTVAMTILFGCILEYEGNMNLKKETLYIISAVFIGITAFSFISSYTANGTREYYIEETELDSFDLMTGEYRRNDTKLTADMPWEILADNAEINNVSHEGVKWEFDAKTSDQATIYMPVINYKGYVAKTSDGRKLKIQDSDQKTIMLTLDEPYEGRITLEFREPIIWRLGEIISLIAAVMAVFYYLWSYRIGKRFYAV